MHNALYPAAHRNAMPSPAPSTPGPATALTEAREGVYVINMDRSRDRWAANWEGREVTRVPAVDGRALDVRSMRDTVAPATRARVCFGRSRESKYDINRPEAVGCYLSHRKAWQRALDDGRSLALVFEDDVRISDADLRRALATARARFAARPELDVLLFDPWDVSRDRTGRITDYAGMYAYAVSNAGARRALEATRIVDGAVDRALGALSGAGELNIESAAQPRIRFSGGSTLRHNLTTSERMIVAFAVPLFLLFVAFVVVAALLVRKIRTCAQACRCPA